MFILFFYNKLCFFRLVKLQLELCDSMADSHKKESDFYRNCKTG
jgi:hypothetical protein